MATSVSYASQHFNVWYKNDVVTTHALARDIKGMRPEDVKFIWMIEENRRATDQEIQQLCSGGSGQQPNQSRNKPK